MPTFAEAVETVIGIHSATWKDSGKTEAQWRSSLATYASPRLGHKSVDAITTADVLAVLVPIWNDKRETARRVRQRISAVMAWSVAEGYRPDDPSAAVSAALPKGSNGRGRTHQRALPHAEVADAIATVRESQAWPSTKLVLEFLALTAARSGEVRLATWDEIDTAAATWTVPAERTKTARPHRVPLSARALAVLDDAREFMDTSGLIFPSATGRAVSGNTLSKLMRELKIEAVPHGFRSSFRDWCSEVGGVQREVAEASLAHVVKGVEGAYARSDLLDQRRAVMEAWAVYLRA